MTGSADEHASSQHSLSEGVMSHTVSAFTARPGHSADESGLPQTRSQSASKVKKILHKASPESIVCMQAAATDELRARKEHLVQVCGQP